MIRTNIQLLNPYADNIAKCKSFKDYLNIFFSKGRSSNYEKGSAGENFFDELCIKHSNITGFTATDFRPATPDEDYYEGIDTVGKSLKEINGVEEDAMRQDKFRNPYNPKEMIVADQVWRAAKKIITGEIKNGMVLLCTNLYDRQIDNETKNIFPWRVTRDNYEQTLKGNAEFFRNFAKRIEEETNKLQNQHSSIIDKSVKALVSYEDMDHQTLAVKHVLKNTNSFIQLPPGSGKTNIQRSVVATWFDDCRKQVYVAPTLDLLDQNFYTVALHCKTVGIDFSVAMICSRKTFSTNQGKKAFLNDDEIVYGTEYDLIESVLMDEKNTFIGITYNSYRKLIKMCKEHNIKFDRIADEVLEIIPGKELYKESKDADEEKSRWHNFADMSVINRSANFDAFEKVAKSDIGPGTNNKAVFGNKFTKSFADMIDLGTIVPLQLRIIKVKTNENSKHHKEWWNDEDKLNFNGLCKALDDLLSDSTFINKKMIAFMHNAPICNEFKQPIADYLQGKIDYVESIIAVTKDRTNLLQAYKEAKDAVLLNFAVLGKGIDDDSTPAVFIGRNMASVYGMHGIHRGCRSHNSEIRLVQKLHIKKPFGIAYVMVVEDDENNITEYEDLRAMLIMLYSIGWKDNVKIVKPAKPRTTKDIQSDLPESDPELIDWTVDPAIYDQMIISKDLYIDNQEDLIYDRMVEKLTSIDMDDDYFTQALKIVNESNT